MSTSLTYVTRDEVLRDVATDWLDVAVATGEPDFLRAERGLIRAYRAAGLRPPRVTWLPSPWAGVSSEAVAAVRLPRQGGEAVLEPAWTLVHRSAFGRRHELRESAGLRVDPSALAALERSRAEADRSARGRVLTPIVDQIQDDVRRHPMSGAAHVDLALWHLAHLLGQWDAGELTWVDAAHRLLGTATGPVTDGAHGLAEMARAGVGLWWCRRDSAVLTPRPVQAQRDAQGRLHSASGAPALAWSDGWAVYAWHGVRVPADLATGQWDVPRIMAEPNVELRRCAIERMGWRRFIADASLRPVGAGVADPGNPGQQLTLFEVPDRLYPGTAVRLLVCSNGTVDHDGRRRLFGLTVPAEISDPLTAAAWTYGLDPETYASAVRRS